MSPPAPRDRPAEGGLRPSSAVRPRSFTVVTFGCKVNQAEGRALAGRLRAAGLVEAPDDSAADLVIVNTCAVTAEAIRQCRQRIRRAFRSGAAVAVTGCAAHSGVAGALAGLPPAVRIEPDKDALAAGLGIPPQPPGPARAPATGERARALLKVQDGCTAGCAYCIVPLVRPRPASLPIESAASQVEALCAAGYREVVLCGIHLGLYGADLEPRADLADLLQRLLAVPGLGRLRLSSIEPTEVTDRLLALMAAEPERVCPHLHVPLQSGDDAVLGRMGRPYGVAEYLSVIGRIRAALPDPAITTDVLVGFPGETEAALEATLRVCQEARFSRMHVFPFSVRPGTRAALLDGRVPAEAIRARRDLAMALGETLAAEYRARQVGRSAGVVIDRILPDGAVEGISERYLKVRVHRLAGLPVARGQIVSVRITGVCGDVLEADAVSP